VEHARRTLWRRVSISPGLIFNPCIHDGRDLICSFFRWIQGRASGAIDRQLKIHKMLSIKVIDEVNKEDYPMHFAYNEKRKSVTLSFAGRYASVDMVNTIDDLLSLISAKVNIAMEGSIGEQLKERILRGESIFVVDRQTKTLK